MHFNRLKIILFYSLIILQYSCIKNDEEEINKVTKKEVPTEVGIGVEIVYTDSSKLKATLNTPKMIRYLSDTNPTIVMPNGLTSFFYDGNENKDAMLKANYGIRYIYKNITFVRGNVIVVNQKNDTLFADELYWMQGKKRIETKKFVKVKTAKEIILADGFESDQTFSNYKFYKVRATIALDN